MLKVKAISRVIFPEGLLSGTPCSLISISKDGEEKEVDQIFEEVLSLNLPTVFVKGNITENPELKEILNGLASKSLNVIFATEASDSLELVRRNKNTKLFMSLDTSEKGIEKLNKANFGLLTEDDSIKINLKNLDSYQEAKEVLSNFLITRPTVLFGLPEDSEKALEILGVYLSEVNDFKFKTRVAKAIKI